MHLILDVVICMAIERYVADYFAFPPPVFDWTHTHSQGPLSSSATSALRLNAAVVGLGPKFSIKLLLQNGGAKPLTDLTITFAYNCDLYALPSAVFSVPLLLPVMLSREHGTDFVH